MNELTNEERLMLWDAMFAGYFNTPFTPTVLETVYNMSTTDIRTVIREYAIAAKLQLTEIVAMYEAEIVGKNAKIATYTSAKAAVDVAIGELVIEDLKQ